MKTQLTIMVIITVTLNIVGLVKEASVAIQSMWIIKKQTEKIRKLLIHSPVMKARGDGKGEEIIKNGG